MLTNIRSKVLAGVAAVAATAAVAMATPTAPVMGPIPEVVDYASVSSEVSAAGGEVVLLVGTIAIGFGLAWAIIYKAKNAVGG